ncbi:hypothetical protein ANHS_1712 [Ligilactobacillus ruminis ATCC 25644]|nr:hypothetical protein ANHS_1712 [Ligilactobacillus ruminis ATCC 25644]
MFGFFNPPIKNYFFQAAVLLNQSIQDFTQSFGQILHFIQCVRKRQ